MKQSSTQNRQFRVILLIVFLGFLGISIPYLIFPALFLNPEFSFMPETWSPSTNALMLGVTLAAYPFGQFIGSPILGALSDDFGRKSVLTLSLLITAICNLFTGFSIYIESIGLLIFSRFAAGVMEGNIAIARAMATDLTGLSKHKTFGKINASASIAYLIGPFIGGLLTDKNFIEGLTTSSPFYLICFLFFGLSGLAAFVLKSDAKQIAEQSLSERFNLVRRIRELFTNKRLQFLMITSTALTLAIDIFYEFGPVFLTIKWSFGPSELIYFNAVLCLSLAIGNGWLPTLFSNKKRFAIIFSMIAFSCLILAMLFNDSYAFMLVLFGLIGLFIGLSVTLMTVKISDAVSNKIQGEVMGVQISLRVLGDAIICLLGGVLLALSSKIILALAAALALATMGYYAIKSLKPHLRAN